jgi:sporulation integral membrane protein YlbJ
MGGIIMKHRKERITVIGAACMMALLILDAKTALTGAQEGVDLCLRAVIPSLFPFFVVSVILTGSLSGRHFRFLRPLCKLCGIPKGADSILLLGFLGGYPVGAQAVASAYKQGNITAAAASRMMGFCSNAGPAFLFGMISPLFSKQSTAWILWLIHIVSALLVGIILPDKQQQTSNAKQPAQISITQALSRSLGIMANVCGWVIFCRVILAIMNRWIVWLFPEQYQVLFNGLIELSNGCFALRSLSDESARFVISASILAFGGICVGLQTISVTAPLGTGMYFPGKVLQCLISTILASIIQLYIFPTNNGFRSFPPVYILCLAGCAGLMYLLLCRKKVVAICR